MGLQADEVEPPQQQAQRMASSSFHSMFLCTHTDAGAEQLGAQFEQAVGASGVCAHGESHLCARHCTEQSPEPCDDADDAQSDTSCAIHSALMMQVHQPWLQTWHGEAAKESLLSMEISRLCPQCAHYWHVYAWRVGYAHLPPGRCLKHLANLGCRGHGRCDFNFNVFEQERATQSNMAHLPHLLRQQQRYSRFPLTFAVRIAEEESSTSTPPSSPEQLVPTPPSSPEQSVHQESLGPSLDALQGMSEGTTTQLGLLPSTPLDSPPRSEASTDSWEAHEGVYREVIFRNGFNCPPQGGNTALMVHDVGYSSQMHAVETSEEGLRAIVDSGATSFLTGNRDMFVQGGLDESKHTELSVVDKNGKKLMTSGQGPVILVIRDGNGGYRSIRIAVGFYMKGFGSTLLSVPQLEEQGILFDVAHRCLVNLHTNQTVARVTAEKRTYLISLHPDKLDEAVAEQTHPTNHRSEPTWSMLVKGYDQFCFEQHHQAAQKAASSSPFTEGMFSSSAGVTDVLVLFSGSGSVERTLKDVLGKGVSFTSLDIVDAAHITHCMDIGEFVDKVLTTLVPGSFQLVWASPPCNEFSKAKTRGTRDLEHATFLVECALKVINYLSPAAWFIENPVGLLREQPCMQPLAEYRVTLSQCRYGAPWRKNTDIWTSECESLPHLKRCTNLDPCLYKKVTGSHPQSAQGGPSGSGRPGSGGARVSQQIPGAMVCALMGHLAGPAGLLKDKDVKASFLASHSPIGGRVESGGSPSRMKQQQLEALKLLHKQVGHANGHVVLRIIKSDERSSEFNLLSASEVDQVCGPSCDECLLGKARRSHAASKEGGSDAKVRPYLHLICDASGPYPTGVNGIKYGMAFRCTASGYVMEFLMKSRKESAEMLVRADQIARSMLRKGGVVLQQGESAIASIQTDNAKELVQGQFQAKCSEMQIHQIMSTAYSHEHMAKVERMHGVLFNMVRTFLLQSGASSAIWPFALAHAAYVKNRIPSKGNPGGVSSYEVVCGVPDPHFDPKVWGCDVFMYIDVEMRKSKLQPRAMKLTYCGNDENSLSFICVDFSKSPPQVYKRTQVEFRQDQFTALRACAGIEQLKASEEGQELSLMEGILVSPTPLLRESEIGAALRSATGVLGVRPFLDGETYEILAAMSVSTPSHPQGVWMMLHQIPDSCYDTYLEGVVRYVLDHPSQLEMYKPMYTKFLVKEEGGECEPGVLIGMDLDRDHTLNRNLIIMCRTDARWYLADVQMERLEPMSEEEFRTRCEEIVKVNPKTVDAFAMQEGLSILMTEPDGTPVSQPSTRAQMLHSPDRDRWMLAEQAEFSKNEHNRCLQLTNCTEKALRRQGYEIIGTGFAYKAKIQMVDGQRKCMERKVRLVARGNQQWDSFGNQTFAATPPYWCLRLVLILATECGLRPQQADVVSAFQIPELQEKIAVRLPAGFNVKGQNLAILHKTMQGIKQASKIWGDTFHKVILSYDNRMVACQKAGKCMYALWTGEVKCIVVRWVDDIFGFSSDGNSYFNGFLKAMAAKFPLKMLGDMRVALGTEIEYAHDNSWAVMLMEKAIVQMAEEYRARELIQYTSKTPITSKQLDLVVKHEEQQGDPALQKCDG